MPEPSLRLLLHNRLPRQCPRYDQVVTTRNFVVQGLCFLVRQRQTDRRILFGPISRRLGPTMTSSNHEGTR